MYVVADECRNGRNLQYYNMEVNKKKKWRLKKEISGSSCHILARFAIILICGVLSYIIPAGAYDMQTIKMPDGTEREVVNAESFHNVDQTPVTLMQFLTAVPRGLQESAQIVFFIFIVGGTMAVVQETKAIEAGMGRLIRALKKQVGSDYTACYDFFLLYLRLRIRYGGRNNSVYPDFRVTVPCYGL